MIRGINNLKYDIHYAPRSSLHIPNSSVIQVQHLLTVAMHHGWNSTNDTCILHFFFSSLAYFSLICQGNSEHSFCVFVFHLPNILMI